MTEVVIVKYGEIALKGANRPVFEKTLLRNLRWALRDLPEARVTKEHGRFRIEGADTAAIQSRATRVFGVVGTSVARAVAPIYEDIALAAEEMLGSAVVTGKTTFKVESRRSDKSFPLTSPELSKRLGAHLLAAHPQVKVDVHQPQVTINVEVRANVAYVYADTLQGPGGLPVGVSSQGLLLISGGIDSPVAGWLAMRRGIRLAAIHFHSIPYTSERAQKKVVELTEILAAYSGDIPLYMVRFTEAQLELQAKAPPALMMTLMRRLMLRVATELAAQKGIPALITGESVGQVASQTLESLAVINAVTCTPILRPLITYDKSEIMALARRIGTYETSILPYEDCCTLFLPRHPETRPTMERVEEAEAKLDIQGLVQDCLSSVEEIMSQPHTAASLYEGGPLITFS
ncbi:MAG: tRNA 4-thiouridine(8) synthase ThiI [Firmicutes bacterium]|jgi:thiamine biosynthesis protein ThiI|nr:tRNA 4-thiouridine(8) synthase ThiI [Bacillota bacterium]